MVFCQEHDVSFDWLLRGDLRGLCATEKSRRTAQQANAELLSNEFRRILARFSSADYPTLLARLREDRGDGKVKRRRRRIGQKAQSAEAGRTRQKAEAVKRKERGV